MKILSISFVMPFLLFSACSNSKSSSFYDITSVNFFVSTRLSTPDMRSLVVEVTNLESKIITCQVLAKVQQVLENEVIADLMLAQNIDVEAIGKVEVILGENEIRNSSPGVRYRLLPLGESTKVSCSIKVKKLEYKEKIQPGTECLQGGNAFISCLDKNNDGACSPAPLDSEYLRKITCDIPSIPTAIPTTIPTTIPTAIPTAITSSQPPANISGLIGQMLMIEKKLLKTTPKLNICIETGKSIKDEELMFEITLAYSDWLDSSFSLSTERFNSIQLIPQNNCNVNDTSFSAHIVIVDPAKETEGENLSQNFAKASITCSSQEGCNTSVPPDWQMRGGGLSYMTLGSRWTSVNIKPMLISFNHNVEWRSLLTEVLANPRLTTEQKQEFSMVYQQQIKKISALQNYWDQAFLRESREIILGRLKTWNIIPQADPTFDALAEEFFQSGQASLNRFYIPKLGIYSHLLYLFSHQLGVQKGDDPLSLFLTEQDYASIRVAWNDFFSFLNIVSP